MKIPGSVTRCRDFRALAPPLGELSAKLTERVTNGQAEHPFRPRIRWATFPKGEASLQYNIDKSSQIDYSVFS